MLPCHHRVHGTVLERVIVLGCVQRMLMSLCSRVFHHVSLCFMSHAVASSPVYSELIIHFAFVGTAIPQGEVILIISYSNLF